MSPAETIKGEEVSIFETLYQLREMLFDILFSNALIALRFAQEVEEKGPRRTCVNYYKSNQIFIKALTIAGRKLAVSSSMASTLNDPEFRQIVKHDMKIVKFISKKLMPRISLLKTLAKMHTSEKAKKTCEELIKIERLIIENNRGLVYSQVIKIQAKAEKIGIGREELFSQGVFGLYKALDRFNPKLGFEFSTFAVPHIWTTISEFLKSEFKHYHASLNSYIGDSEETERIDMLADKQIRLPSDSYEHKQVEERIRQILKEPDASIFLMFLQGSRLRMISKTTGMRKYQIEQTIKKGIKEISRFPDIHEVIKEILIEAHGTP